MLPQVPSRAWGRGCSPKTQHVPEWLQKGQLKLGDGVCPKSCPQPAQQRTRKSLTQTFIVTETS